MTRPRKSQAEIALTNEIERIDRTVASLQHNISERVAQIEVLRGMRDDIETEITQMRHKQPSPK